MTSFVVTSSLVLRNARNPSVKICHFSGALSLDFIYTVASIIDNVCTLQRVGSGMAEISKAQIAVQCSHGYAKWLHIKPTRAVPCEGRLS